jgi:hypothetical protein
METITVNQTVRPTRFALIVRADAVETVRQAVSLNTVLWGGIYNPIVPVDPVDEAIGLLNEFDPDRLVNLTGGELPGDLTRIWTVESDISAAESRAGKRVLRLGTSILPILHELYEPGAPRSRPSRIAVFEPSPEHEGWSDYVTVVAGSFQHVPPLDVDFRRLFVEALRAHTIPFHPDTPRRLGALTTPIQVTGYSLGGLGSAANVSTHVVFVGDHQNIRDLVDFWNLRATRRSTWFLPVAKHETHLRFAKEIIHSGQYAINPQVQNSADIQKGRSITDEDFRRIGEWIQSTVGVRVGLRTWHPHYGRQLDRYVGDIHVDELEAAKGREFAVVDEDNHVSPIRLVPPPFAEEVLRSSEYASWQVGLQISGPARNDVIFQFPCEKSVERVVRRQFIGHHTARLGRAGVVVEGKWFDETLRMIPVKTTDVFYALFSDAGFDAQPSQPGRYAEIIIEKMGSLHFDCRVFKFRGVREVIRRLSNGSTLTQGNMRDIIRSEEQDQFGRNWRSDLYDDLIIRAGRRHPPDFSDIFQVLLERRVIRPGFTMRCDACNGEDWYHISEFGETYTCRFCFSERRVNFARQREWQYRSDGPFRMPDGAFGSLSVILSIWRFADFGSLGQGRYLTSTEITRRSDRTGFEIDYAYLSMSRPWSTDYELVLGEAKGFEDLDENDVRKMREVCDGFRQRPWLAFSTLKDTFSEAERQLLRLLAEDGYQVIALTRDDLDPYDLYDRFDKAPHKHAVTLRELSVNTLALNFGGVDRSSLDSLDG